MPRSALSNRRKAAYSVLYEAELEHCVAKFHLKHEKARAEHALLSLADLKVCDLGAFHKAEASVLWWRRVVATATRIVEE